MKILLIGNANHQLLNNHYSDLKLHNNDLTVDILNRTPFYKQNIVGAYDNVINLYNSRIIDKIPFFRVFLRKFFIRKRLNIIKNNYDIIHIHYLHPNLIAAKKILETFKGKLYITIWGSDFYRLPAKKRQKMLSTINCADSIFFANQSTLEDFKAEFNIKNSCYILTFGIKPLEFLKNATITNSDYKALLDLEISETNKYITIGYNKSPQQQHLKIIESLMSQSGLNNSELFFVVPLTYGSGNEDYVNKIKNLFVAPNFKLLREYMSDEQVAKLRIMTDIFIQLQTTDQLSGSMLEHLAAGNVVITGSWLPYESLLSKGVHLELVDTVSEVGNKLLNVLERYEEIKLKCKMNSQIIHKMFSFDSIREQWMEIYK